MVGRSDFVDLRVQKLGQEIKEKFCDAVMSFLTVKTNYRSWLVMLIGYARVSTHEQNLDLQRDALEQAGCEKVIVDVASGKGSERSGLDQLREILRAGDVLVVWRLDRLGRSLRQLIDLIDGLEKQGVGFRSQSESIDTTTAGGKLFFHIIGALAEFERNIIADRTKAGLVAARVRGRLGGRPKKLSKNQRNLVTQLYRENQHSIGCICETFKISKTTLYTYVRQQDNHSSTASTEKNH